MAGLIHGPWCRCRACSGGPVAARASAARPVVIPALETLGSGKRAHHIEIRVLPLAAFRAAVVAAFGAGSSKGRLPVAFWDGTTIFLRADRTPAQQLRDFKHEICHAFTDWLDIAHPDPGDGPAR